MAKKSSGTYFFSHAKIPKFSSKTHKILRIQASNEYKRMRRPILPPQGTNLVHCDQGWSILIDLTAKNIFQGDLLRFKPDNLFPQLQRNERS